ncbi:MAG: sigma-70 family RNA polymerase sigma factor [Planctomycetales bacterium]
MTTTRRSFIARLQGGGDETWRQLQQIYRPLIMDWLRQLRLTDADVEDVSQEIMLVVLRRITEFDHNGRVGAFRNWLRTIAANATRSYLRKGRREYSNGEAMLLVEQMEDPSSTLSQQFDREHNHYVLRELTSQISSEFQANTMEAFRLHVLQQQDVKTTASQLGMSERAVYIAKSRVMRRLREEASEWLDELMEC